VRRPGRGPFLGGQGADGGVGYGAVEVRPCIDYSQAMG
jgi:hypothetical protein